MLELIQVGGIDELTMSLREKEGKKPVETPSVGRSLLRGKVASQQMSVCPPAVLSRLVIIRFKADIVTSVRLNLINYAAPCPTSQHLLLVSL